MTCAFCGPHDWAGVEVEPPWFAELYAKYVTTPPPIAIPEPAGYVSGVHADQILTVTDEVTAFLAHGPSMDVTQSLPIVSPS